MRVFSVYLLRLLISDNRSQLLLTRIGDTQVRICRHTSMLQGVTYNKRDVLQNRLTTLTNTNRKWGGTSEKLTT